MKKQKRKSNTTLVDELVQAIDSRDPSTAEQQYKSARSALMNRLGDLEKTVKGQNRILKVYRKDMVCYVKEKP